MNFSFEINTKAGWANEETERKRKEIEDWNSGLPPKKPKRGRKPNPKPANIARNGPTRLRKDKPVRTGLVTDVWEIILDFCPLEKLLKLRGLSPTFHSVLSGDKVWRASRLNQFGSDHPPPPNGLAEWQYANLLIGTGCHGAGCKEKNTRRTYWAFQRRWCEKCCHNNIKKVDHVFAKGTWAIAYIEQERCAKEQLKMYERASKCIPHAMFDSWNHYQWAGHHEIPPPWASTYGAQTPVYSKYDIEKFNDRLENFLIADPKGDEIDQWFKKEEQINAEFMKQLQTVETWMEMDKIKREKGRVERREERIMFYQKKAMNLLPPLEANVLELCPSYDRAIQISKAPSQKSWTILLEKLKLERAYAATRLARIKRARYHLEYRQHLTDRYHNTLKRRSSLDTPEQRLVLNLADQVIYNLLLDPKGINEADIVNVVLREVYDAYQNVTQEDMPMTYDHLPYRLIMDDARLVYERRIIPMLRCFKNTSKLQDAKMLKCPEPDCKGIHDGNFEFEDLMSHLRTKHYRIKNIEILPPIFVANDNRSLWLSYEWPRNLPMQAVHQQAQDEWDIDAEISYTRAVSPGRSLLQQMIAASTQVQAFRALPMFTSSVLRAADTLRDLGIGNRYKAIIALEFAFGEWTQSQTMQIQTSELSMLRTTLQTFGYGNLFQSSSCMRCRNKCPYSVFGTESHNLGELAKHYMKEHLQYFSPLDALMPLPNDMPTDPGFPEDSKNGDSTTSHIDPLFKVDETLSSRNLERNAAFANILTS
ncbi:uncharacterized protein KY384_001991 [Bacidia gigantensis]|uniref:uncharacterized protein n=1 Tax=Bacidia gigantensis TaxID=2732470 RepID=UPI001D036CD5|nr:uncharacterized protein KY384_001991 [Bacidia gigantensis]KAG8533208.1 hypothetical protein KY384_001991 [Bacidia gigantensis]